MSRAKPPCGNPLFLQWVEELRDAAKEKGSKAYESYSKAARSLAACPVPYTRPRELVVLQGIGEKTASILEGKWKKHCEDNGLPPPGSPVKRAAVRKTKPKAVNPNPDTDEGTGSEADIPAPPKKRKPAKPKQPKPYIPQPRSGGYGILLGLVLAIDSPHINTQVFLTKTEVIRASQPYSDASYDHSEKGGFHTAWNSMKTLIGKGYVYVTGNPHKYCLTEEGYDVACAIRGLIPEFSHIEKHPFIHTPADPVQQRMAAPLPRVLPAINHDAAPAPESSAMAARRSSGPSKFQFWYIDPSGRRVTSMSSAMVRLDPVEFNTLRKIEFRESQRNHPFATQLRLVDMAVTGEDDVGNKTIFGFVQEEGAPPTCSRFDDVCTPTPAETGVIAGLKASKRKESPSTDDDWVEPPVKLLPATPLRAISSTPVPSYPSTQSIKPQPHNVANGHGDQHQSDSVLSVNTAAQRLNTTSSVSISTARTASSSSIPAARARPAPRLSSHVQIPHPLATSSTSDTLRNLPDFSPSQCMVYPAGSYDIVLILDTREVESKNNRDRIAEKLSSKGVQMETRALKLGDVTWIAKRKDGVGGEEDECVLDYVLERKRLDDLCSSIRDGRYNEQCFRLSNSGISHVYYLIEDWQTSHHMEFSGQQIMTAKSQIQVHNRFFLKETHTLSETIDFLTAMTSIIRSTLAQSDLHIIPTRFLSRSSFLPLKAHLKEVHPEITFHTSFQAYQDLNDKSASLTLRDKFGKMLLCVKGMSAERVSAVLDQYETPRQMWDALNRRAKEWEVEQQAQAEREKGMGEGADAGKKGKMKAKRGPELFFADRIPGEGRRKIGDALSRDLWKVFMGRAVVEGDQ